MKEKILELLRIVTPARLGGRPGLVLTSALMIAASIGLIQWAHLQVLIDAGLDHLSRDIGIAGIVSASVTLLYEAYFRHAMDMHKIEAVISAVYGSYVPAIVWGSIKDTLTKRKQIRTDMRLRLDVTRLLVADWLSLKIELEYQLFSLAYQRETLTVIHKVDEDIAPTGYRANFSGFVVGGTSYSVAPGTNKITPAPPEQYSLIDGSLEICADAGPFESGKSERIRTQREEFRHCPGLYYLVLSELTCGVEVFLQSCPVDVSVHLTIWPRGVNRSLVPGKNPIMKIDDVLLPGHCLEFRFQQVANTPP